MRSRDGIGTALVRTEATWGYDRNGRKTSLADARGYRAEMTYDGFGRQRRWIFPSPTTPGLANPADYEEYGWDPNGNRISLRNRAGQLLAYGYDALNRMTLKDRPGSEPDIAYRYDLRGLQRSATFPATGESVASAWDGFGRIVSSTTTRSGVGITYAHQHDADGHRTAITHPDGATFAYERDGLGRVSAIRLGGATLISLAYDPLGRRAILTRGDGSAASYGYDGASRLTRLFDDLPGAGSDREILLGYNPASQIVSRRLSHDLYAFTGIATGTTPTPADGLNRMTAYGGVPLSYDGKGNMTSDGSRTFAYDSENRLSNPAAPFHYDPLGRLAGISASAGAPLALAYDNSEGEGLIAERLPGSLAPQRRHVFGPGVDEPLIWYEGSGTTAPRYLHADERGSIVAVTDATGAVQNINRYDEYGRTETSNSLWVSRFGYTGQRYFGGTGLYYYKARFYHPRLGRFMQVDPVAYDDQINLYAYVGNDPVNKTDPSGTVDFEQALSQLVEMGQQAVMAPIHALQSAQASMNRGETISLRDAFTLATTVAPVTQAANLGRAAAVSAAERQAGTKAAGLANPFRGKSLKGIARMFERKGFEPRGPDPAAGKGGYVNPETGRSYHLDSGQRVAPRKSEPAHVDVNRDSVLTMPTPGRPKRKFPIED